MNRLLHMTALSLAIAATPLYAETTGKGGTYDRRITSATYFEGQVYKLITAVKTISLVEVGVGERIKSIAIGDTESFKVVKLDGDNLFTIKPVQRGASTNMTVETNRRVYFFRVVENGGAGANYALKLIVGTPPKARKSAQIEQTLTPYKYAIAQKSKNIDFRPVKIWDDGEKTYFEFAKSSPIPALFRADTFGLEHSTNTQTQGRQIIATSRSKRWVLRLGDAFLCIVAKPTTTEAENAATLAATSATKAKAIKVAAAQKAAAKAKVAKAAAAKAAKKAAVKAKAAKAAAAKKAAAQAKAAKVAAKKAAIAAAAAAKIADQAANAAAVAAKNAATAKADATE